MKKAKPWTIGPGVSWEDRSQYYRPIEWCSRRKDRSRAFSQRKWCDQCVQGAAKSNHFHITKSLFFHFIKKENHIISQNHFRVKSENHKFGGWFQIKKSLILWFVDFRSDYLIWWFSFAAPWMCRPNYRDLLYNRIWYLLNCLIWTLWHHFNV